MELEGEAGGEGRAIAQFRRLFLGRVSVYRPRDAASAASGSDVTRRDGRVTPSDRLGERPQRRRRATQRRGTFTLWTATRRRQRAAVAAPRAGGCTRPTIFHSTARRLLARSYRPRAH